MQIWKTRYDSIQTADQTSSLLQIGTLTSVKGMDGNI